MTKSTKLTKLWRRPGDNVIVAEFGKHQFEFQTLADLRAFVNGKMDDLDLRALLLGIVLQRVSTFAEVAAYVNKTLTLNTDLDNWGSLNG